jgi:hypothetical protein
MTGQHHEAEPTLIDRIRSTLRPHPRRYQSLLKRSNGATTIELLLAVTLAITAGLVFVQRYETALRSGTAVVHIDSTLLEPGSRYEQSPTGRWIRYTYAANGSAYEGYTFRRWLNVEAHRPKVCFDPRNPHDHLLVGGGIRCGIDSGP